MNKITLLFALLAALLLASPALAATAYVSDELTILLRSGAGEEYRILRMLKTGTALEVLDESNEKYAQVRTPAGEEGYVLKQYLTTNLPKEAVIDRLTKERDRLKTTMANLEGNRGQVVTELEQLREQVAQLEKNLAGKEEELLNEQKRYQALRDNASNVEGLLAERDRLREEHSKNSTELATLRAENEQLLMSGMIRWFLAGGGVFFFGWMIGKISRNKRKGF
jgi:SH3 domain protein